MKFLHLLFNLLFIQIGLSQSIINNKKAIKIVDKSINVIGKCPAGLKLHGKGVIDNLGHYEVPEKTIEIPFEESIAYFPNAQLAFHLNIIERNNNSLVSSTACKLDSIYSKGHYDVEVQRAKNFDGLVNVSKACPIWFLNLVRQNANSLRILEKSKTEFQIVATLPNNQVFTLYIDKRSFLLTRIETLKYNNIYGNTVFATEYRNYKEINGVKIATNRTDFQFELKERVINYDGFDFEAKADTTSLNLKWLPEGFIEKLQKPIIADEIIVFEKLSENIELIKFPTQNSKSLLVKMPDGLAIFETPQDIILNQKLILKVKEKYPRMAIKYLFLSHHHPDHSGGLRAYSDLNAMVITTKGNKGYFNKILKTDHSLNNLTFKENNNLTYDFVPINGFKTYQNLVSAHEIGENTDHTNEHLVFYFPSEKLIWTGDLLFFFEDGRIYSLGKRGKSVYDLILEKNLAVDRIYTAWPLKGQKAFGTVEILKKLVEVK